ncbi:MAG: hypothetical protein ACRDA7_02310 [Metamycoplasmataceae bacterium]
MEEIKKELNIKIIGVGTVGCFLVNDLETQLSENKNISYLNIDSNSFILKNSENVEKILLDKENLTDQNATSTISVFNIKKDIKDSIKDTDLIILVAGLGGVTGTAVTPLISSIAKEKNKILISINISPFLYEGEKKILLAKNAFNKLENKVSGIIKIDNAKLTKEFPELTVNELKKYSDNKIKNDIHTILYFLKNCQNGVVDFSDISEIINFGNKIFIKNTFAIGEERINKILTNLLKKNTQNIDLSTIKKIFLIIETSSDFYPKDFEKINEYIKSKTNQEIDIKISHIINKKLRKEIKFFFISSYKDKFYITSENLISTNEKEVSKKDNIVQKEKTQIREFNNQKRETNIEEFQTDNDDDDIPFFMK